MPEGASVRSEGDMTNTNATSTTAGLDESSLEILERHRRIWSEKPALRRVYQSYFRTILEQCGTRRPIIELGSGPGFFKSFAPETIATDVEATPWIDMVADGGELPFASESAGNIVMIDVFHHIARPARFLEQAARVLTIGGRIIMLEPWTSPLGYLFYRYIHHEGADTRINPFAPFRDEKAAFDGNAVLPRVYFDPRSRVGAAPLQEDRLRITSVTLMPALSWLLTGGFRPYGLLPAALVPWVQRMEQWLRPVAPLCALRALIVLERTSTAVRTCATQDLLHVPIDELDVSAFQRPHPH